MMNCNRNRQMVKRRIYSFQMDGESRAEAICRAFQQYTLVDWALYNNVSFQIVSSVKHPLLMRELSQLMSLGQSFMDSARWSFIKRYRLVMSRGFCLSYWPIGMEMNLQNNLFLVTKCWVIMFLSVGTLL